MAILTVDDAYSGQGFSVITSTREVVPVMGALGEVTFTVTTPGTSVIPIPAGAQFLDAYVQNAGAGGGSGRNGVPGANRFGGGGGSAGAGARQWLRVSELLALGPSLTVTVGAGGVGGAAVGPAASNGTTGSNGGVSRIEVAGTLIMHGGLTSNGGGGGTGTAGTAGTAASGMFGGAAGGAGASGTGGVAASSSFAAGGAGGSGISTLDLPANGRDGGCALSWQDPILNPALGGTAPGGSGATPPSLTARFGGGGGGGAAGTGTAVAGVNGGNGGNGGDWGGGGAGGGAGTGPNLSGAGGNGGNGGVVLTFY